jgi:hypothetical protein
MDLRQSINWGNEYEYSMNIILYIYYYIYNMNQGNYNGDIYGGPYHPKP